MQNRTSKFVWAVALALGTAGFAATPLTAQQDGPRTMPRDTVDNHPDRARQYEHNHYYQLGNKEGLEDHQHNMQRKAHDHKFNSSFDREAHDYGYTQGWRGENAYHSH